MYCTTSETEGEVVHVKVKAANLFITDRSKAIVLFCFAVACFGVRVSETFHLMRLHIIFSSI